MESTLQAVTTRWITQVIESLGVCPNTHTCSISKKSSAYLCDVFLLIANSAQVPVKILSKCSFFMTQLSTLW